MPGKCPACGGRLLKRTSRNGYAYYACERGKDCPWRGKGADGREIIGFMTWDVPTKDNCPECGKTLFKRSGRGRSKPFCINPECPNYVPPEQRGYKPKQAKEEDGKPPARMSRGRRGPPGRSLRRRRRPPRRRQRQRRRRPPPKKTATRKSAAKKAAGRANNGIRHRNRRGPRGQRMCLAAGPPRHKRPACRDEALKYSPAHKSADFASSSASNSLRGDDLTNAVGLLKEELRRLGSLIMESAEVNRVAAGGALAVDRAGFARYNTETLENEPNIEIVREEAVDIPEGETVIATARSRATPWPGAYAGSARNSTCTSTTPSRP